jgi:mannan endo-1,4-beta-mannosidase
MCLAFVLILQLLCIMPGTKNFAAAVAGNNIVTTNGMSFIMDGKPFRFPECNNYDLFTYGDGSNDQTQEDIGIKFMDKARIDIMMSQMAEDGIKVVRTWGFSYETWHGFEPKEGVYNKAQFMLFDYILESAKKNNIKVIIVLENYWESYGGIDTRLKWEGLPGVSHPNRSVFFTDKGCKEQYKNYAGHFVTRINQYTNEPYKDNPTIFSWELINEPGCQLGYGHGYNKPKQF